MIASIRGEVLAVGAGWVVISSGGLGFRVEIPASKVPGAHVGEQLALHTSLVVREDSLTLFGFSTGEELEMFGLLLQVSGVGPRSALGMLSVLSPAQIAQAVFAEDAKPFTQVSGIGPKTAKLIVVSLAGKIARGAFETAPGPSASAAAPGAVRAGDAEAARAATVEQALIGLGYSEAAAVGAVRDARGAGAPDDEAGLLRAALALANAPRSAPGTGVR